MLHFSFAVADSMFPEDCVVDRRPLPAGAVRLALKAEHVSAVNPSHLATLKAAESRYGIKVEIPATAPQVKLKSGDSVIVMSVRGLPRLGADRHEYTEAEIEGASFVFGEWTVH